MSNKYNKNLINYVSKYKVPKAANLENKHNLEPIFNKEQDTKYNKNINTINNHYHKKRKFTSVSKINSNNIKPPNKHNRQNSTGSYFYNEDLNENSKKITNNKIINNENEIKNKLSKEIYKTRDKTEKINELYNKMKKQNALLQHELLKREEAIDNYVKKYENQDNIIKNLEFILNELTNNKNSPDRLNHELLNDINKINNNINNNFNDEILNDDIFYDDNFQEELAIQAVDQQIMDELCPNPDLMSYEQLLDLEDNVGKVNKGLTEKQIDNLPFTKYHQKISKDIDKCIICMDEFKRRERVKLLPCGHIFHNNCIKEWLLKENTCPFCKTEIK